MVCSMVLLSESKPNHNSSLLLVEQLLYLAHGESYLQELDITLEDERPPSPSYVSHDLWQSLHKIPLSTEYFSVVIKSIHDNPEFWTSLNETRETQDLPTLPWRVNDDSSPSDAGLDEYVLQNCLCPEIVRDKLLSMAGQLVESIEVPELSEIIESNEKSRPLLLLHSKESLVSQANLVELEDELKKCLPVRKMCPW